MVNQGTRLGHDEALDDDGAPDGNGRTGHIELRPGGRNRAVNAGVGGVGPGGPVVGVIAEPTGSPLEQAFPGPDFGVGFGDLAVSRRPEVQAVGRRTGNELTRGHRDFDQVRHTPSASSALAGCTPGKMRMTPFCMMVLRLAVPSRALRNPVERRSAIDAPSYGCRMAMYRRGRTIAAASDAGTSSATLFVVRLTRSPWDSPRQIPRGDVHRAAFCGSNRPQSSARHRQVGPRDDRINGHPAEWHPGGVHAGQNVGAGRGADVQPVVNAPDHGDLAGHLDLRAAASCQKCQPPAPSVKQSMQPSPDPDPAAMGPEHGSGRRRHKAVGLGSRGDRECRPRPQARRAGEGPSPGRWPRTPGHRAPSRPPALAWPGRRAARRTDPAAPGR